MYTGHVSVGGPADVHELGSLIISKLAVGPYDNNAYLLRCRETGVQVLVDAANEPRRLLEVAGETPLDLIVTTHRHPDHWQALVELVEVTGCRTAAHPLDAPALPVWPDLLLEDGDTLNVGHVTLTVIHLVGHTEGSIALLFDDPEGAPHLLTGDCLFPGGIGRTTLPEEFETLYAGVVERIFDRLPDETWIYPGHGYDTTVGAERPQLAEWYDRKW